MAFARIFAVIALAATVASAEAADFDIAWFEANPQARAQWLRSCRSDVRLARDPRCGNAEKAEDAAYARRLGARSGIRPGQLPPEFETPMLLNAARRACARPPAQRGLFARYCPNGT